MFVSIRERSTVTSAPTRRRACGGPAFMIIRPVISRVGIPGMGGMGGVPGITGTEQRAASRRLVCVEELDAGKIDYWGGVVCLCR